MTYDLDSLLLEWEDRNSHGECVSAQDLCPDSSEAAAELQSRITALMHCNEILGLESTAEAAKLDTYDDLLLPQHPIPHHEIRQQLGRGGMGFVYEAFDTNLQRTVAVKMIRANTSVNQEVNAQMLNRFKREAKVLARLKHPHIVPIYSAYFRDQEAYFAMEFVNGGTLAQHAARFSQAGPRAVVQLMRKVAEAVHFAHTHGVLHRDLKPGNILLDGNEPRVSDFGLAKYLEEPSEECQISSLPPTVPHADTVPPPLDTQHLTREGFHPGTPGYMAPEVLNLPTRVTPATDVWGLGAILYELLTGDRFIDAKQDIFQISNPQVISQKFSALRQTSGQRLSTIVEKCLAQNPHDRYQTAEEVAAELRNWEIRPRYVRLLGACAMFFLVLLAGIQFLPTFPPHSPAQVFESKILPLLHQLDAEGVVHPVASGQAHLAQYLLHDEMGGTVIGSTLEGLLINTNSDLALVELLPRLPDPNKYYRITAVLQFRNSRGITPQFGAFVHHTQFDSSLGRQHYFHGLGVAPQISFAGPEPTFNYMVRMEPRLFALLHSSQFNPIRNEQHLMEPSLVLKRGIPQREPNFPRIKLELIVGPDTVKATFEDPQGPHTFAPLTESMWESGIQCARVNYPDLREIDPKTWRGSSVGLYFDNCQCLIESFTIQALVE